MRRYSRRKEDEMYRFIKLRYELRKITAADVWGYADNGTGGLTITEEEAKRICGARPE